MANERHTRRGRVVTLAALSALAVLAAACGGNSTGGTGGAAPPSTEQSTKTGGQTSGPPDAAPPRDGGPLVMAIEAEPEGMDPTRFVLSESGHTVASAVFDPLATLDENGKAVPYLAKSIEGSDGNRTWTITLPTDVTFHDGTPLTAQVVLDNLKAYQQSYVTKLALQTVASMEAPDSSHVVVKLTGPWAAFPTALTSQLGYVLAPAMLTNAELVNKPIGTGPFVFDSHRAGEAWRFKKNPTYWRKGLPHLDSISFLTVADNAERLKKLQSGDIDLLHTNDPQSILTLRGMNELKRVENNAGSEQFIVLNTQAPPFDNLSARQAVASAIDTVGFRKDVHLDVDALANSPFAPGQLGYEENNGYPTYDVAKAKAAVAAYKTATGKDLEFTLLCSESQFAQEEAQYLAKNFTDAGMKATVKSLPQLSMVAQDATGNYQASVFRNFSFPDPDTDTVFWRSTSIAPGAAVSLNFPRHVNTELDALIDKALASTDPAERNGIYQQMGRLWAKDLPYVWLGRPTWTLAAAPRVNGIYVSKNGSVETIGAKTWIAELWIG